MLISSFSLPSNATDKPHFLKERIMESFIFPTLDHASPTHFVIRTLRWLAFILPSTYWSRFLSKWSSNKESTSSLNGLFINTSTTWTRDVHPSGTRYSFFAHDEHQNFPIRVLANWIFKRISPFGRNPFLHKLFITPSLFLIHDFNSSVITLLF